MQNLELLIKLFNVGKLKIQDADWLKEKGYFLICEDGEVKKIVRE